MKTYNELESLGFFKWLSETHNLVDTDMESEYLDKLPLNDIHRTVCNSMAFRWFREKHNFIGVVGLFSISEQGISSFEFHVDKIHYIGPSNFQEFVGFKTYEEAESGCIDKLIEIVKNK